MLKHINLKQTIQSPWQNQLLTTIERRLKSDSKQTGWLRHHPKAILRLSELAIYCFLCPLACQPTELLNEANWPVYLGDSSATHYSALNQINRDNVHQLQIAWTYSTEDNDDHSQIQCNPIIIRGRLYATSPKLKAFCLDASTGENIWTYDPLEKNDPGSLGVNRGVVYWEDGHDQRIFYSAGYLLFALSAHTGLPIPSFGDNGQVDLRKGISHSDKEAPWILATTPPALYRNLLIIGSRVGEGPGSAAAGDIRAIDTRTGQIQWTFHTVPKPNESGYETWPAEAWTYTGGANSWAGMTVDTNRGIVFAPTGSPTFDFWGGNRNGKNLYGNCVLAISADTGKLLWYFQTVHHDLWDRDLPAPPNLVTITREGKKVDAVAQVTKWGVIFVLDRETGEPLFPVEERPVPSSDLDGEESWPTQPFPLKPPPFSRHSFTEADVTNISPESQETVLKRYRQIRNRNIFEPPSTQGTLIFPGYDGGANWGGAAFDASTGKLYINSNEMPWILTMIRLEKNQLSDISAGLQIYRTHCASCHGDKREGSLENNNPPLPLNKIYLKEETRALIRRGKGRMLAFPELSTREVDAVIDFLSGSDSSHVPPWAIPSPTIRYSFTGYNRFLDPDGYPAIKPPWGQLTAIDLNLGSIVWQVPLGEFDELTKQGLPPTGTENYGGPMVTAGGLLFIGATKDEKFRAFNTDSGGLLWETKLPAGGYATPSTFSVHGRQYVVIATGGGKMGTASDDKYIAFALPQNEL